MSVKLPTEPRLYHSKHSTRICGKWITIQCDTRLVSFIRRKHVANCVLKTSFDNKKTRLQGVKIAENTSLSYSVSTAVSWMRQTAVALAYAHDFSTVFTPYLSSSLLSSSTPFSYFSRSSSHVYLPPSLRA